MLQVGNDVLIWGSQQASFSSIDGFYERYDGWRGAAWLEVRGPGWRVPIDASYGPIRVVLRSRLSGRPFDADWQDGRFPSQPLGWPPDLLRAVAWAGALVLVGVTGWQAGAGAAALASVVLAWPLARLTDRVQVAAAGLTVGPSWSARVPWHEVVSVELIPGPRASQVWLTTAHGGASASIPSALLPALRGRLQRLGGVNLHKLEDPARARYLAWRGPSLGITWGVLAAVLAVAWWTPWPWEVLATGLLVVAALAMLAAVVEARVGGWGLGTVIWSTGVYAVVLLALSLGVSGWL